MSKSATGAYELLKDMAMNNHQWSYERASRKKKTVGMYELDAKTALTAQEIFQVTNPKDQCKVISLRSRKELEESIKKCIHSPKVEVKDDGLVEEKLHINIPFVEALEQIPSYVKFMKEILLKKRRLEDYGTVALTEEYNAILQKKLPLKLKDPVFQKLKLGKARPTTISLKMANRSVKYPRGVIEDVLVKRRVKSLFYEKFKGFDDIWDSCNILNGTRRASTYDIMALKDAQGGLDPS
uniref:Uncharacterized protein n=1 Tax=Cannabis sativa TaxID=3483 RepID=A0A803NH67_CANSA